MESNQKPLSKFWKITLSVVAILLVSSWLFGPRHEKSDALPAVLAQPADESFAFDSSLGSDNPVLLNVQVWRPSATRPCTSIIASPSETPRLERLKRQLANGTPDDRLGVVAEVLARCTQRFVYLDGGGEQWQVGEYIGRNAENVTHGIRLVAQDPTTLVLEFTPGVVPQLADEIVRIEKLIADAKAALDSYPGDQNLTQRKVRYQAELEKLKRRVSAPVSP